MKYNLYYDRLVSVWERDNYEIEAENEEEAVKKLEQLVEDGACYDESEGFIGTETLSDSEEATDTWEIINANGMKCLKSNLT